MRTVPAPRGCCGLRIARPHPRRAARGGIRLHPRRGPQRESRSGLGAFGPGDVRGVSGDVAAPYRMILGEETRARTPRLPERSARVGTAGSGARAACQSHAPRGFGPVSARAGAERDSSFALCSLKFRHPTISPQMAFILPLGLGTFLGELQEKD